MALVSVIIPNYNHARYLNQRIDSVLQQIFQNFEVILLDDCSTDNSRQIIEQYRSHPKIAHIIYNEENSGSTFMQWQRGIELAKGEWIWIAESDDWCEPTFLQEVTTDLNENTCITFVQSIVVHGNSITWVSSCEYLKCNLNGRRFVEERMLRGNAIVNASMCLFRKECYLNISQDFQHFKFCGDWLFWIEIALQGEVVISGKVLNYFRKHNEDVSSKAYKNGTYYTEYMRILELIKQKKIIDDKCFNDLLSEKYYRLLGDRNIDPKCKYNTRKAIKERLGMKAFRLELSFLKGKFA